ncbi:MAG: hypothetical protein ABIK99_02355 [candidate division WOR-3 bacterium]
MRKRLGRETMWKREGKWEEKFSFLPSKDAVGGTDPIFLVKRL